jgi:hypothetical protein
MAIDRRYFLKYASTGIAFLPVETLSESGLALAQIAAPGLNPRLTSSKAPCRFCGVGCGVMVGSEDGVVKAVAGDELSSINRGLLCVKGYSLPAVLYAEDRLPYSQIRTSNGLQRATWDEALDLIGARYRATLDQYGPEAIAVYGSGQWTLSDGYVASKWFRAGMGSNNVEANARLCMASAVTGFRTSFGMDEPMGNYEDLGQQHGRKPSGPVFKTYRIEAPQAGGADHRHRDATHSDHCLRNGVCEEQAEWRPDAGQRDCTGDRRRPFSRNPLRERGIKRNNAAGISARNLRRECSHPGAIHRLA